MISLKEKDLNSIKWMLEPQVMAIQKTINRPIQSGIQRHRISGASPDGKRTTGSIPKEESLPPGDLLHIKPNLLHLVTKQSKTLLHFCPSVDYQYIISYLISLCPELSAATDETGKTPLMYLLDDFKKPSKAKQALLFAKVLIGSGSNINQPNSQTHLTPLESALELNPTNLLSEIEYLFELGADPSTIPERVPTALLLASHTGRLDVFQTIGFKVKELLERKKMTEYLKVRDENGQTVEQIASRNKEMEKILKLIKK